jgi:hypothetical protein
MRSGGAYSSAALHFWHALEGKSMLTAVRMIESQSLVGFMEVALGLLGIAVSGRTLRRVYSVELLDLARHAALEAMHPCVSSVGSKRSPP